MCPQLVAPDNGQVFFRGVTVGSTARYSCLPGFVLRGAPDRTCLSEGTWSGREPVCEAVNCPDLPDPANGEVTLSGIIFGSTATYRYLNQSLTIFFPLIVFNLAFSSVLGVRLGLDWLESALDLAKLTAHGLGRHQLARVRFDSPSI